MAVHLPRKVVEHIGTLEDGQSWDNDRDTLDDGDFLWVTNQQGRVEPHYVTDAHVASDAALEQFLRTATGDKIDVLRDDYGRFQYLVYRYDSHVGASKIIDANGSDCVKKTYSYSEPENEWWIDDRFNDKYARCYGNWSCQNRLEELLRNYKNSAERYRSSYRSYAEDYRDFFNRWNPNDGDVTAYLRSQADFIEAARYYVNDRSAFEGYQPQPSYPRYPSEPRPIPPSEPRPIPPSEPHPIPDEDGNNPDEVDDI